MCEKEATMRTNNFVTFEPEERACLFFTFCRHNSYDLVKLGLKMRGLGSSPSLKKGDFHSDHLREKQEILELKITKKRSFCFGKRGSFRSAQVGKAE